MRNEIHYHADYNFRTESLCMLNDRYLTFMKEINILGILLFYAWLPDYCDENRK